MEADKRSLWSLKYNYNWTWTAWASCRHFQNDNDIQNWRPVLEAKGKEVGSGNSSTDSVNSGSGPDYHEPLGEGSV